MLIIHECEDRIHACRVFAGKLQKAAFDKLEAEYHEKDLFRKHGVVRALDVLNSTLKDDNLDFLDQFNYYLRFLETYACSPDNPGRTETHLYPDKHTTRGHDGEMFDAAPYDFYFTIEGPVNEDGKRNRMLNGGLLFHGSHDGYGSGSGPTFAVCLTATQGWSIHT